MNITNNDQKKFEVKNQGYINFNVRSNTIRSINGAYYNDQG